MAKSVGKPARKPVAKCAAIPKARRGRLQLSHSVGAGADAQDGVEKGLSAFMFDPYLTSNHKFIITIADNLAFGFEFLIEPRKRKMKARDRATLKAMLMAVLANLARARAEGVDPPSVAVSLRAARQEWTRYERRAFTGLPALLATLSRAGIGFQLDPSDQRGRASTFSAVAGMRDTLNRFKFRSEHFAFLPGRETIQLSKNTPDHVAGTVARKMIPYKDETPETRRYRAEMQTINAAMAKAPVRLVRDGEPEPILAFSELRRAFNLPADAPDDSARFDLGGRLFGGWWQNLEKHRRRHIRIDGEPIADLDFSSMFLRLAYLEAGLTPPGGDLYAAVQGFSEPQWREGVKQVTNAMFFRTSPLTRLPKGTEEHLPLGTTGRAIRTAILAAHPGLSAVFETGIGLRFMFHESQILIAALLRLIKQGIIALPMHDGFMCQKSKTQIAMQAMQDAAVEIVGFPLPITLKSLRE